jgi:hypothetical protein
MAFGQDAVLVMIRHAGFEEGEVADALRRKRPGLSVSNSGAMPTSALPLKDAVELALVRRGIEPLRVAILPQQRSLPGRVNCGSDTGMIAVEPMPWLL